MKRADYLIIAMLFLLIFTLFIPNQLLAQDDKAVSDSLAKKFQFALDYNRFRYADSLTFFEFSAGIYRDIIKYVPDADKFKGEFLVTAQVLQGDSVIAVKRWKNVNTVDSLEQINDSQQLYCINNFILKKGNYNVAVTIKDVNSGKEKSYKFPVKINDYTGKKLIISDIQLATQIERDSTKSMFVKNGFKVFPNPRALYGIGLPILYSYSEIYNLAEPTSEEGKKYKVTYRIFNADGDTIKTYPPKIRIKPGTSSVEVNGVNVVTLVSGPYYFVLEVEDLETGQIAKSARKFYVYRAADFAEGGAAFKKREEVQGKGSPGEDADRYDVMSEKELKKEFDYARYISTKEERNTFKKLNLEGKRQFLKDFWAKRDQTPTTPINEFKRDYLGRVQYANRKFKGTFREGWRTDRGRILLVYGHPDEIERFPFSSENKTYEVWHYFSIQGGIDFIFVDKREMGDLELVHSTARGELYDPDWQRWISPTR